MPSPSESGNPSSTDPSQLSSMPLQISGGHASWQPRSAASIWPSPSSSRPLVQVGSPGGPSRAGAQSLSCASVAPSPSLSTPSRHVGSPNGPSQPGPGAMKTQNPFPSHWSTVHASPSRLQGPTGSGWQVDEQQSPFTVL